MDEPSAAKRPSVLTIDRAAFLLLRVKRAFKKKRQQRKEKHVIRFSDGNSTAKHAAKSKRTHNLVDEAFLEQKDVLLDMLESKLKEVRDKKKKKTAGKLDPGTILESNCNQGLKGEVKLTATGVSAVGEIDTHLKFGESGKGTLEMTATGISNIGRSRLDLGVDGNIHIPGLGDLFTGNIISSLCDKTKLRETENAKEHTISTLLPGRRNEFNETVANKLKNNGTVANGAANHEGDEKNIQNDTILEPTANVNADNGF